MNEVKWKHMTPEQKTLFRQVIAKEWDMWLKYQVTRPISEEERQQIKRGILKPVTTRWVFVWKAGQDGSNAFMAKARLVVQGCLEKNLGWQTWSPTATQAGLHLTLLYGAQVGRALRGCDCKNAYLQSSVVQVLQLPLHDPLPPGCAPGELRVATRAVYGSSDSGCQCGNT